MAQPLKLSLELVPRERVDVVDARELALDETDGFFAKYARALYCSYHTTAGFVDERLAVRLDHNHSSLGHLFSLFGHLFPPEAGYRHDQIEDRTELSEEERLSEPHNADSHLTYIGSGLRNCLTCDNRTGRPVYFVDLDGQNDKRRRTRQATVLGYKDERQVGRLRLDVPVSSHQVESVNLGAPDLGFADQLAELVRERGVRTGRVEITLADEEEDVGLTVNEYETLLMRYDLAQVLRNPLHFAALQGIGVLADPRAVPAKVWNYAKYDFVQVVNELIDLLGLQESIVEHLVARTAALPASRMLRMKRSVSFLVSPDEDGQGSRLVRGRYQTPILFQWRKAPRQLRTLGIAVFEFQ